MLAGVIIAIVAIAVSWLAAVVLAAEMGEEATAETKRGRRLNDSRLDNSHTHTRSNHNGTGAV